MLGMKKVDTKALIKYIKQWVAIDKKTGKILVGDTSFKKVEDQVKDRAKGSTILFFVPPADKYLSPICQ